MTSGGTYVYGVWRAEASMPPSPPAGIEDRPVFAIECGPLAALASEAPAGPVRASRRNLLAHSGVLQAAVGRACVLPMRFGVVLPDSDAVESELLRAREDEEEEDERPRRSRSRRRTTSRARSRR